MPLTIPLLDTPRQEFSAVLDGQSVLLEVHWNETAAGWFVDLAWPDSRGPIVQGRAIVHGSRLVGGTRRVTGFRGDLVAIGPADSIDLWGDGNGELIYLFEGEIAEYDAAAQATVADVVPLLSGSVFEQFQLGGAFVLRFRT